MGTVRISSLNSNEARSAEWVIEDTTLIITNPGDEITITNPTDEINVTKEPTLYRGEYDDDIDR
jgi:hypothetical protein